MNNERSVALVGRPNVGKSRLFNRLAGRRIAIVHDEPGVTRDVNAVEIDNDFILMDTGGIGLDAGESKEILVRAVEEQVNFAIQAAGLILFMVDGRDGCTPLDEAVAEKLRQYGKEPILVINKIDTDRHESLGADFARLGFDQSYLISAEHGRGTGTLRESIDEALGPKPQPVEETGEGRIQICFAGRPNVGKSSICNRLFKSERLVVTEVPGTTRDSVSLDLDYRPKEGGTWPFRLIDTAGVRKKGKMSSSLEFFSSLRSESAMDRADVVFLVLDALSGVTKQDKSLAGHIIKSGKTLAVVVNKWDLALEAFQREPLKGYENEKDFRQKFSKAIYKELFFLPDSPILFVSALKGFSIHKILFEARQLDKIQSTQLSTPKLNRLIAELTERQRPPIIKGKRFKVYYAVQTGARPFQIRLYCNLAANLDDRYRRYLEKGFHAEFDLQGCPMRFQLAGKPKRSKDFYQPQVRNKLPDRKG